MHHGRPLDEAFSRRVAVAAFAKCDRAFIRNLSATTLRRLGQIDALIAECLAHGPPQNAAVEAVLRLGAAELLFLHKAPHAAVNEAVELAGAVRAGAFKGLVNAVLRRVARDGTARLAEQDAARLNTPAWLWNSWQSAYGAETAHRIADAHLEEAPLDLSVRKDPQWWAERLGGALLAWGSVRIVDAGPIAQLDGYREGAWWVQDAAAALPVRLLGDVRGKTVLDLCAAPGGKTAQLAAARATVTAVDKSPKRAKRLAQNLSRLGLAAEIAIADAAHWRPPVLADAVLLDAPCTATGTIRRHPDLPWRKRADDVPALAAVQDRLLAAAAEMVRPGGMLAYCVCSLQPEEGDQRIARFLAQQPSFQRAPVAADEIGGVNELVTAAGDIRTLPCHLAELGGLDGFFIARLVRRR